MSDWIGVGDAAMHRLVDYEGDIEGAAAVLDGLTSTKPELMKAIAYLALQVRAYRRIANEDAALAIRQIGSIVRAYDERRPEVSS